MQLLLFRTEADARTALHTHSMNEFYRLAHAVYGNKRDCAKWVRKPTGAWALRDETKFAEADLHDLMRADNGDTLFCHHVAAQCIWLPTDESMPTDELWVALTLDCNPTALVHCAEFQLGPTKVAVEEWIDSKLRELIACEQDCVRDQARTTRCARRKLHIE